MLHTNGTTRQNNCQHLAVLLASVSLIVLSSQAAWSGSTCVGPEQFAFLTGQEPRDDPNSDPTLAGAKPENWVLIAPNTYVLADGVNLFNTDDFANNNMGTLTTVGALAGNNLNVNFDKTSQMSTGVPGFGTGLSAPSFTGDSSSSISGGGSVPVLSTIEVSTNQAEELIRQRRDLAEDEAQQAQAGALALPQPPLAGSAAPQPTPTIAQPAAPSQPAAAPSQSASAPSQPAARPAQQVRRSPQRRAVAQAPTKPGQPNISDTTFPPTGTFAGTNQGEGYGMWAQAYGDYERHSNLNPGSEDNPTRKQRTFGFVGGFDKTMRTNWGRQGLLQLGILAGHNQSRSNFSDTPNVTNSRIDVEGGFVGGYATYQSGPFAMEVMAKADLFDHKQRAIIKRTETTTVTGRSETTTVTCNDPARPILLLDSADEREQTETLPDREETRQIQELRQGKVSENNYTVGTNFYYRFDLEHNRFFEPVIGVRYTYTDFGSGAESLNLQDGQVLRVQGGARIGKSGYNDGYLWSVSFLGSLYSDVFVDGYTITTSGFTGSVADVDEGKLRALGQFSFIVSDTTGWSLTGILEARGGEDVYGVGGRLGARYEW